MPILCGRGEVGVSSQKKHAMKEKKVATLEGLAKCIDTANELGCIVKWEQEFAKDLRQFCNDVLMLISGIGWFNVDDEKKRAYKFIESNFPDIFRDKEMKK